MIRGHTKAPRVLRNPPKVRNRTWPGMRLPPAFQDAQGLRVVSAAVCRRWLRSVLAHHIVHLAGIESSVITYVRGWGARGKPGSGGSRFQNADRKERTKRRRWFAWRGRGRRSDAGRGCQKIVRSGEQQEHRYRGPMFAVPRTSAARAVASIAMRSKPRDVL
jgi:hypothetical protein